MEISYWQSRWEKNNIGWHMDQVYPLLRTYWNELRLDAGATVLVPLCGKSLDLDWLAAQGHRVIGVDVSGVALQAVVNRQDRSFTRTKKGAFTSYRAAAMDLWCGDFFKLNKRWLPKIDAAYDKAALIALPPDERRRYAAHLQSLLQPQSQMLLNCFEYRQNEMNGPPFAVFEDELQQLFGNRYAVSLLHDHDIFDRLAKFRRRGLQSYLREKLYHLRTL